MKARYLVADALAGLATLEDSTVDLVVTSPPFFGLRSYLPDDHPDKAKEIGQEETPADYIDNLLAVTAELRRVLAPHGSIAVELGDTNGGSGGAGGDYGENGWREGQPTFEGSAAKRKRAADPKRKRARPASMNHGASAEAAPPARLRTRRHLDGFPRDKSRGLIPETFRWALTYGINPFTGAESPAGDWITRNVVTWCRPNPTPGFIGDRWRYGTSDIVVATQSPTRYWDDLATRHENPRVNEASRTRAQMNRGAPGFHTGDSDENAAQNPAGAPMLDWWVVPPTGYTGAHYAVMAPAIVAPIVAAMAPRRVCRSCGEPSRRIVESDRVRLHDGAINPERVSPTRTDGGGSTAIGVRHGMGKVITGESWSDCGHDDWRLGLVLDCFGGSGTTGAVATGHGHDAVLIDLDPRNAELARDRIGPMLFDGPHYVTKRDDVSNLHAAETEANTPNLFDVLEEA